MLYSLLALTAFAQDSAALDKKVEAAVVETIHMTTAGDFDGWINKYCDPARCGESRAREQFKAYQLKQANLKAKKCLWEGDKIKVSQRNGEVGSGKEVRWYIKCEGRQLPIAVRFWYDKDKDHVWFSHLGF